MRVLLVGANGRLGRAVAQALAGRHEMVAASRTSAHYVDLTNPASIDVDHGEFAELASAQQLNDFTERHFRGNGCGVAGHDFADRAVELRFVPSLKQSSEIAVGENARKLAAAVGENHRPCPPAGPSERREDVANRFLFRRYSQLISRPHDLAEECQLPTEISGGMKHGELLRRE